MGPLARRARWWGRAREPGAAPRRRCVIALSEPHGQPAARVRCGALEAAGALAPLRGLAEDPPSLDIRERARTALHNFGCPLAPPPPPPPPPRPSSRGAGGGAGEPAPDDAPAPGNAPAAGARARQAARGPPWAQALDDAGGDDGGDDDAAPGDGGGAGAGLLPGAGQEVLMAEALMAEAEEDAAAGHM